MTKFAIDALLIVEADDAHVAAEVAYTLMADGEMQVVSRELAERLGQGRYRFIFGSHLEDIYEVEEDSAWVEDEGPTQPPKDWAPRS